MKKTMKQLHVAAQYLSAAGISFLDKESDDSHTNLGWNSAESRIESHPFGSGNHQLAISLVTSELEWLKDGVKTDTIELHQNTHSDLLDWISKHAYGHGVERKYAYKFHYNLPYAVITDGHCLTFDADALKAMIEGFNIGQEAFEKFLSVNNLTSPIRIWSHHFDLGIYTSLNAEGTFFMGAGLAIPDSLVDDFYYYAAGYDNGVEVVTKSLSGLSAGEWRSDWNGATLASSSINVNAAANFLNEAREEFLGNV
ncbi:MAG: hypothetical protein ACI9RU_000783 [Litorivivens sp.]|jgi:hypothetical protein